MIGVLGDEVLVGVVLTVILERFSGIVVGRVLFCCFRFCRVVIF